jgi:hypothetical protein
MKWMKSDETSSSARHRLLARFNGPLPAVCRSSLAVEALDEMVLYGPSATINKLGTTGTIVTIGLLAMTGHGRPASIVVASRYLTATYKAVTASLRCWHSRLQSTLIHPRREIASHCHITGWII